MSHTFFDAVREQFANAIPHARECGLRITRLDGDGAEAVLPYRPEWLGDPERGLIHTGIITTLVDTVAGLAAFVASGKYEPIATLDLRMDYLRPARPDKALTTRAECYRLTRSIAFVRATVWQDNEAEPVAASQATFMRSPHAGRKVK
jgi:uncharacterized protein (TIGR00369 family)